MHPKSQANIPYNTIHPCLLTAREWGRILALFAVVIALWCTIYDRWDVSVPVSIDGNAGFVLGMLRLAQNGELGVVGHIETPSLGAPFLGNLNDYPQNERVIIWIGGALARFIGLYKAANTMVIGLHLLAAISFYYAARLWRASALVAWSLALVYAMSHQTVRSLPHLGIGYFGLLPLQLYVCWYVATTPTLRWSSHRFKLSMAVGLLSGALSVYWMFFFVQIYLLSTLYRVLRQKGSLFRILSPILLTGLVASLLLGSFVIYQSQHGRNATAVARSYRDVERYALKPIDLFIPKGGQAFGLFNNIYSNYSSKGLNRSSETATVYIGLLSIFGLLLILIKTVGRQVSGKNIPISALGILWVLSYASFGGLNALISLTTNSYLIRATNRYSAVISTIALLYFALFFHSRSKHWPAFTRIGLISAIATLALVDQTYSTHLFTKKNNPSALISHRVEEDRRLVDALERRPPPQSMLFMLPVVDFPESGSYKLGGYEYFRPFLHSTQLRYSFGSNKGRPEADWQHEVSNRSPYEIAKRLESYGFAGVLLNRRGYNDGGQELLAGFAEIGYLAEFEQGDNNEWVFIRLNPAAVHQLPALPNSRAKGTGPART